MVTENNTTAQNPKYTSSGQGDLNTVLGAIGTAAAFGLFGGNGITIGGGNRPPPEPPATQRDLRYERELTEKDAQIGRLEAEKYADAASLAVERRLADKIEKLETAMNTANATQAVINAQQTGVIGILQTQVATLNSMTAPYIKQPVMAASEAALTALKAAPAAGNSGS